MDRSLWRQNILQALQPFYDEEFQEMSWRRGEGDRVSSFSEATCVLFDDCEFKMFIDEHCGPIRTQLDPVFARFDAIIDSAGPHAVYRKLDPAVIGVIRNNARALAELIEGLPD